MSELREIPLGNAAPLLRGALDVERTAAGIVPVRLPAWAFAQAPDDWTREVFRLASGVRLALRTEASALELDVALSQMESDPGVAKDDRPGSAIFDLVADGRDAARASVERVSYRSFNDPVGDDGRLLGATPRVVATVRFDGLPRGHADLEVWLPTNAVVELCALRADAPVAAAPETRPRWIHYGSHISHGAAFADELLAPTEAWPAVAARRAGVDLVSLGVVGNCLLDPFVARAIGDAPADVISLKLGHNVVTRDAFKLRTFAPAVHGFLDTIREGQPETPIHVVSPTITPALEDRPGPIRQDHEHPDGWSVKAAGDPPPRNALTLRRIPAALAEVVDARAASDPALTYLDGLRLFGEADVGDLTNGVHPNAAGYARIGERFAAAALGAAR